MRALVLGGGGFLGTNLCRALLAEGHEVRGYGRRRVDAAALAGVEWHDGTWPGPVPLDGVEVVFDLIGGGLPARSDVAASVTSVVALLTACQTARVARIVFASSGGTVYGVTGPEPIAETAPTDPVSAYGIAKLVAEKLLALSERQGGPRAAIARIANPYGSFQDGARGQGLVAATLHALRAGQPVEVWGDGGIVRDYLHIDDVVRALLLAAAEDGPRGVFNLGSGIGRSIVEVIAGVGEAAGITPRIVHRPARPADVPANVLDCARLRGLGWVPQVGWAEGLALLAAQSWASTPPST